MSMRNSKVSRPLHIWLDLSGQFCLKVTTVDGDMLTIDKCGHSGFPVFLGVFLFSKKCVSIIKAVNHFHLDSVPIVKMMRNQILLVVFKQQT